MNGTRLPRMTGVLAATLALSTPSPAEALAAHARHAVAPAPAEGGAAQQREDRLALVQQSIERAFIHCDAGPLKEFLARHVKIYVAAGGLGISDGYYSADQLLLLLRRMFDGRSTVRFTLLPAGTRSRSGGQALVRALWLYREDGAPENEARMAFTLAPEGGHWSIREIRELQ